MKLVVATTGASGAVYAQRTFELLAQLHASMPNLRVHWVASPRTPQVWRKELDQDLPHEFGDRSWCTRWDAHDFTAPFASGSNAPDAMIVIPCSMSTLARVAHGGGDDLISRGCEVALKERRRLVLVVRETPLHLIALRNMVAVTEAGAVVAPAMPSFYADVRTLQQAIDTVVVRALDLVGLRLPVLARWGEAAS